MYRRHVSQLRPGQTLAKALYSERGGVLLGAGTVLNQFFIERLRERGVISVFLQDGLGDDVEPEDIVSEELRAATVTHLKRAFDVVGTIAQGSRLNNMQRPSSVSDLIYRLGDRPLDLPPAGIDSLQSLYKDIESLMSEILESNTIASLESLKTHNDYTFQHSVDVAVLGILLGRTAGLPRDQLRELALGCLLHDLGKMYIDQTILDKPSTLTPEEFDEIKKHPQMGFELIRRMPVFSILPAHVAYQHHERQDGGGYPRDVVLVLTRTIPMYPVGHWVEVLTGTYRGWRGVVSELAPEAINMPTIRLLLNERGDRVPSPVDVSLRANDDVQIRGLAPGDTPFELGVAV
jgi:hypothetical protein